MTNSVFCPKCGRKMLVDWEFSTVHMIDDDSAADGMEHVLYGDEIDPIIVWSVKYDHKRKCPYCGAELEISHVLVPHFTAEFAR